MLTVHQVAKRFGVQPILENITFHINRGERWGLIGPNGCGKTTLLRIISGHERSDSGHVTLTPAGVKLGYLAQGFEPDSDLTIATLLANATGSPDRMGAELARLGQALAETPDDQGLQEAYDLALDQLSRLDSGRAPAILAGLGLGDLDPDQPAGTLSGGQKTRLGLTLLLLEGPDLLVLDEPTNHLDIPMQNWLEEWLHAFSGAVLLVSHDRAFLDRTITGILEIDPGNQSLRAFTGNYSEYLRQVQGEREKQWSQYRDQVYEVRRIRQDIARTKAQAAATEKGTTDSSARRLAGKVARKAKTRQKKLDRYLASPERVEKPARSWQMNLAFSESEHLGRDVLEIEDLTVGYPGHPALLRGLNLHVQAGSRVVLTGPNGSGKTTLLRTLAGIIPAVSGRFRLGHSVQLGYMSQEQEQLDPDRNAFDLIAAAAAMPMTETDIRSFLHYFLFEDDEPLQPIHTLSYGERARLALARLVVGGCNFLLLDEPINHLDIPSRTRFEHALDQFDGAILAVVHDRYFIERFAGELWTVNGDSVDVALKAIAF